MNNRMRQMIDQLWEQPDEDELHVRELEDQLSALEPQVQAILQGLPDGERTVLEGFIYGTAELELYTVAQAYKRGRKIGEEIGKNKHRPLY